MLREDEHSEYDDADTPEQARQLLEEMKAYDDFYGREEAQQ